MRAPAYLATRLDFATCKIKVLEQMTIHKFEGEWNKSNVNVYATLLCIIFFVVVNVLIDIDCLDREGLLP